MVLRVRKAFKELKVGKDNKVAWVHKVLKVTLVRKVHRVFKAR